MYVSLCIHIYIYVCKIENYEYIYIYVYIYIYIYIYNYIIYIYIFIYLDIYIYISLTNIYIYIYMYIHLYTILPTPSQAGGSGSSDKPFEMPAEVDRNYSTEICSGSKVGSHLRLIDFVNHSTLALRVIKERRTIPNPQTTPVPSTLHRDAGGGVRVVRQAL